MNKFGNGNCCVKNSKGQLVDDEGFTTSSFTRRQAIAWSCVSVKKNEDLSVIVRNTNDKNKVSVQFSNEEWSAFIMGVKNSEFDN